MDVDTVLKNISKRQEEISTLTDLDRPLTIDLGILAAWDPSVITVPKGGSKREDYFRNLAREDTQIVMNRLYEASVIEDGDRILELPEPTTILPRAKPVPKPKPPTKWEQFAKRKGIKSNKDREKLVWDDATRRWVPRYGYKRAKNEEEKNWVEELPDN